MNIELDDRLSVESQMRGKEPSEGTDVFLIGRVASAAAWACFAALIAYLQFREDWYKDWRVLSVGVVSPVIGWLVTYAHSYSTFKQCASRIVFWAGVQLFAGIVLFGSAIGFGGQFNRTGLDSNLFSMASSVVNAIIWYVGLAIWNLSTIILWIAAFANQLLLCWLAKRS